MWTYADKSFALIPGRPIEGMEKLQLLTADEKGRVSWVVAPELCDGRSMTWFLVQGITKQSEFEEFQKHPETRDWATVTQVLRGNSSVSSFVQVAPKGLPVLVRGRVVGPKGKTVHRLQFRLRKVAASTSSHDPRMTAGAGYFPESGSFWIQANKKSDPSKWMVDVFAPPGAKEGIAGVYGLPYEAGKRMRIRLPAEAVFVAYFKLPPKLHGYRIKAVLKPRSGVATAQSAGVSPHTTFDGKPGMRLQGLGAGTYDLVITSRNSEEILIEKKGIVLVSGHTQNLPDLIDLTTVLHPVKLTVIDDEDGPVRASVMQVHFSKTGYGANGSGTDKDGVAVRHVRKDGGNFLIKQTGYAPRLLRHVKIDTTVVLYRQLPLHVQVTGLPREWAGCDFIQLIAKPVGQEMPAGAWKLLEVEKAGRRLMRGAAGRMVARRQRAEVLRYNQAPIQFEKPTLLPLTHPATWEFFLAIGRLGANKPYPIGKKLKVESCDQKHAIEIPTAVIEQARESAEKSLALWKKVQKSR